MANATDVTAGNSSPGGTNDQETQPGTFPAGFVTHALTTLRGNLSRPSVSSNAEFESVMARVEARTAKVDRWRASDQKLRWCAAAPGVTERQFGRVEGYTHLHLLEQVLSPKMKLSRDAAAQAFSDATSPKSQLKAGHTLP